MRAAEPTLAEGRMFARYLDQAAEGFFRFMLGPRSEDVLARAFLDPGHDLSYENVNFATRDGVVVGMVSGYPAERHCSSWRSLRRAAGGLNLRMTVLSVALAPVFRVIDSIEDGDFYLQAIAVDEKWRGEGVGSRLLSWVERLAISCASRRLVLDVSAKNEGARKLYERRGMTVESQWPKRWAIPGLKLVRMTKVLRDS